MPLTVGTAGHIDHGKTTLVEALTGKNTDRLPQERERGISIDLGYAPLELPDGVLPRQRLDECRLAVVDVACGADRQRHRVHGRRGLVDLVVGEGQAVEQQPAVADDADERRLAGAQRRRERLLDRAGEARQLGERERAAADAADRLLDGAADRGCEPLGARAHDAGVLVQHAQHRNSLAARRGRAPASLRARRASACRRARRAAADAAAAARRARRVRRRSRPAGRRAACRPRSRRGPRRPRATPAPRAARELGEDAGAEVVDERQAVPSRDRASSSSRGCSVKPTTRKFDWCTRSRSAVSAPIACS